MIHQKRLNDCDKSTIIRLNTIGHSGRKIAEITGVPKSTVYQFLKNLDKTQHSQTETPLGRPMKLTHRDHRYIKIVLGRTRRITLDQIMKETSLEVSKKTMRKCLHNLGFQSRIAVHKPLVSPKNIVARMKWCRERINCNENNWNNVIWSDESKFLYLNHSRKSRVWRRSDEKYSPKCLVPTVKSNSTGVMVWGCFRGGQIGPLIMVEGIINADEYINILEQQVLPMLPDFLSDDEVYFQDDNAPIHRANRVLSWKERNGIKSMPWPAQSPDLNPIEHLWDELERRVRKHSSKWTNIQDMKNSLLEEWNNIPTEVCQNLVSSMTNRVKAVLTSKGYPTKY
jgi:transposase